jgi:phage shock protein C
MNNKKYYRSKQNSMLGGVCGGLEEYTGIDSIFWRLAFIFIPQSLVAYLLILILTEEK